MFDAAGRIFSTPLFGPIAFAWLFQGGAIAPSVSTPFLETPAAEVAASECEKEAAPLLLAEQFAPLRVVNVNTLAEATVRLYSSDGALDPDALAAFSRVASGDDGPPLDARLVQLVAKAAYELGATTIEAISGYRPMKNGKAAGRHTTGEALDFRLEGVKTPKLAMRARTFARSGVGIYTHPRTQYIHLDVRDESYRWVDGSPPGVTWREQPIPDWKARMRDLVYAPEMDLPVLPPKKKKR
jgi:uncharacterized protein YcbK (DUF882 family)